MSKTLTQILETIKDVPDFPKEGIVFKDITPVLEDAEIFSSTIHWMAEKVPASTTHFVGIESRGFIFAAALAQKLNKGLVLVRKPGKLPRETLVQNYQLEYGEDQLHIHKDALQASDQVLIVDDVLATGGTAQATESLCMKTGAQVLGHLFFMELSFLNGQSKLSQQTQSLLQI